MNKYMKIANDLARSNLTTNVGGPFGACIVRDKKIIGKGSNHVLANNDPTAHAEIMAIREACKNIASHDLSDCEIYTTCFPCPMCLSAIIWANIKKVYYGNSREDAKNIGFRDDDIYNFIESLINERNTNKDIELRCMDKEETIKVFRDFLEKKGNNLY